MPADPFVDGLVAEQPGLLRYASRLTRQRADAEDLTQDTLCHALANRHHFQLGTNLGAWLRVMAQRLCIDRHRNRGPVFARLYETAAYRDGIEAQVIARLELARLLVHIDPAVTLTAIGMDGSEIATRLGLSISTVYPRISRSRRRLRALAA